MLTGYGCEDMFFSADWIETIPDYLNQLAESLPPSLMVAVGFPLLITGGQVFNAVALLSQYQIHGVCVNNIWRVMAFTMNRAGLRRGQPVR